MPIKDSLYKIGKYLETGASSVAIKSGTLIESSKLTMEISTHEKMVKEVYEKIGEKVYKDYKENKLADKNLVDKCEEIDHIKRNINALKKKMLKVNDKKACKKCGAEMDKKATYCPRCGKEQ